MPTKAREMKVTQVAVCPTEASSAAGRPALTPELLAASGARYSRSNEGLEAILSKIDPNNLDKSVDSIFKMIDYGHQSIADMAPVAIFIDGVSLWLAYHVWTLCPTAGGQESSTRYINYGAQETVGAEKLGIPIHVRDEWQRTIHQSYDAYAQALELWEEIAAREPDVARIPRSLQEDKSERAQKQVARMRRNYSFDRARNFLPVAAPTNMMLIMSARGWTQLCQHLLSHPLPEPQQLGNAIREELQLAAPRMMKHAVAKQSVQKGAERELERWRKLAAQTSCEYLQDGTATFECPPRAALEVSLPPHVTAEDIAADLQFHDNRYAWLGHDLQRTTTRFSWDAIALAEIRDLNRHRTGTKWCPLVPRGFYSALDQLPAHCEDEFGARLHELSTRGRDASARARQLLIEGDASYVSWTLLGTQYFFEHTTTADKFLYEAELRTGTGAHFRYAQHLRDALVLWYEQFPATRGLVLEGSAEPE
ncbi:MAG TPA: FAD-dependent thymidylate synthase [Abditibacteriaceae bacterium]|jgi:thymidylate synthase ThyX